MHRRALSMSVLMFALCAMSFSPSSLIAMTSQAQTASAARENPLLKPSPLPFGAPAFDRIQDADYKPAMEAGIKAELDEVAAIAASSAAPTFENTLVALEKSGRLLQRVSLVLNALASANTNPTIQALQEDSRRNWRRSTTRSS